MSSATSAKTTTASKPLAAAPIAKEGNVTESPAKTTTTTTTKQVAKTRDGTIVPVPAAPTKLKRKGLDALLDEDDDLLSNGKENDEAEQQLSTPKKAKLTFHSVDDEIKTPAKHSDNAIGRVIVQNNTPKNVLLRKDSMLLQSMEADEQKLRSAPTNGVPKSTAVTSHEPTEEDMMQLLSDYDQVTTSQAKNALVHVNGGAVVPAKQNKAMTLVKHNDFKVAFPVDMFHKYELRFRRSGDSAIAQLEKKYWRVLPLLNAQIDIVPFGVQSERAKLQEQSMKKTGMNKKKNYNAPSAVFKPDKEGYNVNFFYKGWNDNEIEFGNFATCLMTLVDGHVSVLGTSVLPSLDGTEKEGKELSKGDGIKLCWRLSAHGHLKEEVENKDANIEALDCIAYIRHYVEEARKKLYELKKRPDETFDEFCKNRCIMPVFSTGKYGEVLQLTTKIMRKRDEKQKLSLKDITPATFPILACDQLKDDEDARESMRNLLREYTPSFPRVAIMDAKEATQWSIRNYYDVPFKKGTVMAVRCKIIITSGAHGYSINLRVPVSEEETTPSIYVKGTNTVPIPEKTQEIPALDDLFEPL